LLGILDGAQLELLFVDHFRGLFVHQQLQRLPDSELACTRLAAAQVLEHALELLGHLLHAGRRHDFDAHRNGMHLDFDLALVEFMLAQHLAEALPGVVLTRRSVRHETGAGTDWARGKRMSSTRSSAASAARWRTLAISSSRVILTEISTRSRTIESTSRPT